MSPSALSIAGPSVQAATDAVKSLSSLVDTKIHLEGNVELYQDPQNHALYACVQGADGKPQMETMHAVTQDEIQKFVKQHPGDYGLHLTLLPDGSSVYQLDTPAAAGDISASINKDLSSGKSSTAHFEYESIIYKVDEKTGAILLFSDDKGSGTLTKPTGIDADVDSAQLGYDYQKPSTNTCGNIFGHLPHGWFALTDSPSNEILLFQTNSHGAGSRCERVWTWHAEHHQYMD